MPNSSRKPCTWLLACVRSRTSESRTRCNAERVCCDSVFGVTNRMAGRDAASQIASASQLVEFFATFHTCTVVMEACAGAHHMARKLTALGHQVKLISPQFVRPFVKANKNDFVGTAQAVCSQADGEHSRRLRWMDFSSGNGQRVGGVGGRRI